MRKRKVHASSAVLGGIEITTITLLEFGLCEDKDGGEPHEENAGDPAAHEQSPAHGSLPLRDDVHDPWRAGGNDILLLPALWMLLIGVSGPRI